MTLLESISGPRELKQLASDQLPVLASEIRDLLIETVSRTSGHLGPNLGVVELTIAMHRVFDSPVDKIVFDTGHQSYVHKLLTGRVPEFGTLRQRGGLSGPRRLEQQRAAQEGRWRGPGERRDRDHEAGRERGQVPAQPAQPPARLGGTSPAWPARGPGDTPSSGLCSFPWGGG